MRQLMLPLAMALTLGLSGCSWVDSLIYTVDIRQGTLPPTDKIEQLKQGMTPEQVNYLLGSPSFRSMEDSGHWEYVYSLTSERQPNQYSRLTLHFKNGQLHIIDRSKVDSSAKL
ncbi:outer membrane protein assembly factor BamE [Pelagibaculum spongiae]|uniref:Outer membrane protein assembly factor BamE n=1 Tax=Pelagibaculum spongiae TaxID=2080658 RepID=A0A2V1GZ18_9GAMM|nr:outer membrane protein assembly factor BamE [Pelagibaculum spongiae]PVZ71996.1 hypothetical protein DC094_02955 [Pelagibaculum spongiae]